MGKRGWMGEKGWTGKRGWTGTTGNQATGVKMCCYNDCFPDRARSTL
jgi:hypothetical protein